MKSVKALQSNDCRGARSGDSERTDQTVVHSTLLKVPSINQHSHGRAPLLSHNFSLMELLATVCSGLFSGAALYVTLVDQPVRAANPSLFGVVEFRQTFSSAAVLQASLAMIGSTAAFIRWARASHLDADARQWLFGAIFLFSSLPWTGIFCCCCYYRWEAQHGCCLGSLSLSL